MDMITELAKKLEESEARTLNLLNQKDLELQALKRRVEDLQNHAIKDAKTIREEYDTAVDSLGTLMEDVAKRVTKAVLHYEEKTTNDLEKLREHVTKTVNTQSAVMSQKIDAAFSSAENRQEGDREGESEEAASGTTASTKIPRNNEIIMRRIESVAHMLRAEALAQSQAFEAKLASVEAGHTAESKRLQGMLQSSYAQLQGLQRSISALECGLVAKPQSPRAFSKLMGSLQMPARSEPKEEPTQPTPTLREELTTKLRNIQSSVSGVLTALDHGPTRGQSPATKPRYNKSPVQLPINPAGTLEKQQRQKEYEGQGRTSPLLTTLKEDRRGERPVSPFQSHRQVSVPHGTNTNSANQNTARMESSKILQGQPPKQRQSQGPGMVTSMSQQHISSMMSGHPPARMMNQMTPGVYPLPVRSGMGSPIAPMMAPQAIPMNYAVRR